MSNLMLHCGTSEVTREGLAEVKTPEGTDSWVPIPHTELVDQIEFALTEVNMFPVDMRFGLSKGSDRLFGVMTLEPTEQEKSFGYTTSIGIRNSHDKSFPAQIVLGSQVFVCDNMAFNGEIQISRKHTKHLITDLPPLVAGAVGKLSEMRDGYLNRVINYKNAEVDDLSVHDLVVKMLDLDVISSTSIPDVLAQWRKPSFEDFAPRTIWSLFNAVTYSLKDIIAPKLAKRTNRLHALLDGVVAPLFAPVVNAPVDVQAEVEAQQN